HAECAIVEVQFSVFPHRPLRQFFEKPRQRSLRVGIVGRQVHGRAGQGAQTPIVRRGQFQHFAALLQQGDRRQESLALQTLLVEIMRGCVRGVALVATSNTPPHDLYKEGLQRERFLPAITLLEQRCEVLELASPHDWRLRALTRAPVYLTPDDAHAEAALARLFEELAQGQVRENGELHLNDRAFSVRRVCAQAAWFDFAALCDGPYGSADYIELARTYPAILISGLPQFTPFNEDAAQRFVHLIDELYDRRVKLAVTAQAPVVELYDGKRLRLEFARTISRLIEMQSREYLAETHRLGAASDAPPD